MSLIEVPLGSIETARRGGIDLAAVAESDHGLASLVDPALAPLFWRAERLGATSAWWRHVPFAHWIVCATRPRVLVELGTHAGVSYSAFCQAVQRAGLATRCHAVDTWCGDEQSGRYSAQVYEEFRAYHEARFGGFSTLIRDTFDAALQRIEPGCVDLLHIDGLHTYEAVRHDFENWLPKLSESAVVLFHDVNERSGDFGVWQLWTELRERYPSFTFLHSHGLGVLAVGRIAPEPVLALCRVADPAAVATIRGRFAMLGERWLAETRERMVAAELGTERHEARVREDTLARQGAERDDRAQGELRRTQSELVSTRAEFARSQEEVARAEAELALASRDLKHAVERATRADAATAELASIHNAVVASTAWRATLPLRRLGNQLPAPLRRALRGSARLVWSTVTMRALSGQAAPPARPAPAPPKSLQTPRTRPAALGDAAAIRVVYISGELETTGHMYRVERPAVAVLELGYEATWMTPDEVADRLPEIRRSTILVIWRASWSDAVAAAIQAARDAGASVVFDVDDLMIDPELARQSVIDGIRTQNLTEDMVRAHYAEIRRTMDAADLCTTTTDELASHARRAGLPTFVLPNGFDHATLARSRLAARNHARAPRDCRIRIGYAAGSRTHQRDFALCAEAVADVMRERPDVWLVGFQPDDGSPPILDINEFPALRGLEQRCEWRRFVPLEELPAEIARFDINLAPLEIGNPFCEAKSELKFFEAALAGVPTVASATGPFRRAIRNGETGLLAQTPGEWRDALLRLVDDAEMRRNVAQAALLDVLWRFGPEQRRERVSGLLDLLQGGRRASHAFCHLLQHGQADNTDLPHIPAHERAFLSDRLQSAEVTVLVPLYNYAGYVTEALESVREQTLACLDLVIVDDGSTDDSLAVAVAWAEANAQRFNRLCVLRNKANSGLAYSRNVGFAAAETPWVLPLDADNRLLADCAEVCLGTARETGAAFAYPRIQEFGLRSGVIGEQGYDPVRLQNGNYIDAMALISRAAWVAVGGYDHIRHGWEDYDFWCRLAERGLFGAQVPGGPQAEYRAHGNSMLQTTMAAQMSIQHMVDELQRRHPWLTVATPRSTAG